MSITSYELVTIQGEFITADLLCWRRYRMRAPKIFEALLEANPHLSHIHQTTPFLPVGTQVRIPIDPDILRGAPLPENIIKLWKGPSSAST